MRTFLAQLVLLAGTLGAQWVRYPTAGVPRTADGKPDLAARSPRPREGKPDLSGMWPSDQVPCGQMPLNDQGECGERVAPSRQAVNIATGLAGGLPYQAWAAEVVKQRARTAGRDDPHTHCMPSNFPRLFTLPHITKFAQNPGLLILLNDYNASYRQIFTDGRALPEDPQPSWSGYSSGNWEGDTWVVQTNGFRDDLWLDTAGNLMTSAAKVTERFRRPSFGSLEIQAAVDDAKTYTKPWTVDMKMHIVLDTELLDEICLEDEKSVQHIK